MKQYIKKISFEYTNNFIINLYDIKQLGHGI